MSTTNKKNKLIKIVVIISVIAIYLLLAYFLLKHITTNFSFDDKLSSKEIIINNVKISLPNSKFVKLEEKIDDNQHDKIGDFNTYYFTSNGVEFTVGNYLYKDEYSPIYEEKISDTYMENVWVIKNNELNTLFNKYPEVKETFDSDYNGLRFTPANYKDFSNLDKFLDEYIEILKNYLPYKNGTIVSNITIAISLPNIELYGPKNMSTTKPLYIDNLEGLKNNIIKELQEKYLQNVKLGYIEDDTIDNEI